MKGPINIGSVVDDVLAEANAARSRREAETMAVKIAEAQPRTQLGRGLRSLADALRASTDDITYTDLGGLS